MHAYILRRLVHAVVTLVIVSVVTFLLVGLAPGGFVTESAAGMSQEDLARIRANLGLDRPLYIQYAQWAAGLLRGDMGRSLVDGQPVRGLIAERLPNTMLLSTVALVAATVVGVLLGVVCAVRAYSWLDNLVSATTFIGLAVPIFWLDALLILLFSVELGWLPSSGLASLGKEDDILDRLAHLALPAFVLATSSAPQLVRFTRSSLLETLGQEYVRTARAKGLFEWAVLSRHVLRNSLIPVITIIGLQLPRLVGGTAIAETVFGWPGIGRLAVTAAFRRDFPVILGITIVVSIAVLITNLIVDLLYAAVNPRVSLE